MLRSSRWLLGALLLFGCSSGDDDTDVVPTPRDGGVVETVRDGGTRDGGVAEPDICDELALARQPFATADTTFAFGDVAGDFAVDTLDGRWVLSDEWTGCESYTFLNYLATQSGFEDQLWNSTPSVFVDTPINAHFFFMASIADDLDRYEKVLDVKTRLDAAIDAASDDEAVREAQRRRFHYVLDSPLLIAGSVGMFLEDYNAYRRSPESIVDLGDRGRAPAPAPFFFAIDRDQRWDSGGNLNQTVGSPPSFRMASYLPQFFEYKAGIRDEQAVEQGVETFVIVDETTTDREMTRDVTLPSAAEMESFDTLEFDVSVTCRYRNVFACSEWDRIAHVYVCLDDTCAERRELVRWITPYWRRGHRRWVIDASSVMGLVADGGAKRFLVAMGPTWERATERDIRITLRLRDREGARATGTTLAFTGGNFDADYNTRDPFLFTPPANATRVELVVILSGHGQEAGNNCAEWCDHRHQFTIDGTDLEQIRHDGDIGSAGGCGPSAAQGVPPGQYGNWAPERAYWCPGLPVTPIRIDLTDHVTPGQQSSLTYSATFGTRPPAGGNISLNAYVTWYE